MEGQAWRPGGLRRQAAEGARGRERQAEETAGGGDARQRDAQGRRLKKNGDVRRQARDCVCANWRLSVAGSAIAGYTS